MPQYTEDTLVQQTTAEYLEHVLGWESVFAYNTETFGPEGTLGRASDKDVVLKRPLRAALVRLNPSLPESAYDDAVRQLVEVNGSQTLLATNREKYQLLRDGVQVTYRKASGERVKQRLRVVDFNNPAANHFLCVRELWVRGNLYRRRTDIVCFLNGLPLIFMELKNITRSIRAAFEDNFKDYKDTIPHLFHHNALVILGNGVQAKIGSLSSRFEHFHEWKRLEEEAPGVVDMETLLKGICSKANLLDLVENFIVFDDSTAETRKIIARNHQFLGVNRAIAAVKDRHTRQGKLGVFWHTQGAGKSYSMVFFTRKVHRTLGGNFTFVVLTDREDLDAQLYKTFTGCGVVDNDRDPCRATGGKHLACLLQEHKAYVFSLIQKFNQTVDSSQSYSQRDDIIVITDEAHRTQYGTLALNLRNALPCASYIGFTGTPLFSSDEITRRVFGEYVSTYDFQRAVDDKATVPLYYEARGDKLGVATADINERLAEKLEELEVDDIDVQQRLEKELRRDYHIITAEKRLEQIAQDFVQHYARAWESGKVMLVCIDKITCTRMHALIEKYWKAHIASLQTELKTIQDEQEEIYRQRQIRWMQETIAAVVVSEEQGEMEKFRQWGIDITPHRRRIKEGIDLPQAMRQKAQFRNMQRMALDDAFKEEEHPFRIAIVCAMWLTGFDVPSLTTLYLDKPLKAHTLMQAIARANRIHNAKNNGLIVDYCGILKNLRKALATFAGQEDEGHGGKGEGHDPAKPDEELLTELGEAVEFIRQFLADRGASLEAVSQSTGFARNAAIMKAKEAVNENDQTRKRFEILCREIFKKFKACINISGINDFRAAYEATNIIYKSLQEDRDKADITDIIKSLHEVVDAAIETDSSQVGHEGSTYDISKVDFEKLKKEFERCPRQNTLIQCLKDAIEKKLGHLLAQNPLRTDFQQHYETIVAEYNREKDRLTIESTFEELLVFVRNLNDEEHRAVREGLTEESLVIFDLLKKDTLSKQDIKRVKAVAEELLAKLKAEKLTIDHWADKESTRDAVRIAIKDFLWSEATGLPINSYAEQEVQRMADAVYGHVLYAYPCLPSPWYGAMVG